MEVKGGGMSCETRGRRSGRGRVEREERVHK